MNAAGTSDGRERVVLLCRDGAEAQFLAAALHREGRLDAIIVERGGPARRRKLRRMLGERSLLVRLGRLADAAAVLVYSRVVQWWLRWRVLAPAGVSGYPDGVPRWAVDDANEPDCVARLRALAPSTLVVLGTAILRDDVLSLPIDHILNVHGGVVPEYRNVHSDVWALLRGDPSGLGTSLLHLDAGIDTGDVALIGRIDARSGWGILRVKRANLELAATLLTAALQRLDDDTLPRQPQQGEARFYPTPGVPQVLRLLVARVR